jgi:hypothetical protein
LPASPSPSRSPTPGPSSQTEFVNPAGSSAWTISSDDIEPNPQSAWPCNVLIILMCPLLICIVVASTSFLTDPLWANIGPRHIHVQFNSKFQGGALIRRQGYTQYPLCFNDTFRPSEVSLYWSDNKSIWRAGDVPLECLSAAVPQKQGSYVMVLAGGFCPGEIAKVEKVNKKASKLVLRDALQSHPSWEEPMQNVCLVEDHLAAQCSCSRVH